MKLVSALGLLLCLSVFACKAEAQQNTGTQSSQVISQDETPVYKLEFKQGKQIPFVLASVAVADPAQCSPDGVPFLDEILSPALKERAVVALDPKGGQLFSLNSVPNLYDLKLRSFYPAETSVVFLVYATADPTDSTYAYHTDKGAEVSGTAKLGEHRFYLLTFDRSGNYKSTVELPTQPKFQYRKVAILPSGEFILLGYDGVTRMASLGLYSSSGQFMRNLDLPEAMTSDARLKQGKTGGPLEAGNAAVSLSLWQFANYRQNLLLYQPNVPSPVLEIGSGGAIRALPITAPEGYQLDEVLPGTSRFIVRFRRRGISLTDPTPVDMTVASGNYLLYQVDPVDGSLRVRLKESEADSDLGLACEFDGVLTAFGSKGPNSQYFISTADLPH